MVRVERKMEAIQSEIDSIMIELAGTKHAEVAEVKVRVRAKREDLVPFANLKAAIANSTSRACYFPQHMEPMEQKKKDCSNKFITFAETQL